MKKPSVKLSIIIATFNSEKILSKVLESIARQTLPRRDYEIVIVDGGSTDRTAQIAKKFRCRVITNPRTEPVYGKYLGYVKARGKYIMYLDHDEVIKNPKSIELKIETLESNQAVKAVAGGNYQSPKGYPFINDYINEFGDPFSFFIYRLSKSKDFFLQTMRKNYPLLSETSDFCIFDLSKTASLPLIELVAGASMFDARTLKNQFPQTLKHYELLPHYFYFLHSKYPYLAIIKQDPLIHYSADTLQKYLNKILWRVKNNIYHTDGVGKSGFTGREKYLSKINQLKKYLFIPYAYSLIFPLFDSLWLAFTRKKIHYLFHLPFTIYTATLISYHMILKNLGAKPKLRSYDNSKVVGDLP